MNRVVIVLASFLIAGLSSAAVTKVAPSGEGCLSCHEGVEQILPDSSGMMLQIKAIGAANGDPEGCVVCHGGNPILDYERALRSEDGSLEIRMAVRPLKRLRI